MKKYLVKWAGYLVLTAVILAAPSFLVYSAIMQQSGLAVAQTSTLWNNLKDIAAGNTGVTSGVGMFSPCLWNGVSCDAARGDIVNGQQVNVTKFPSAAGVSPIEGGTTFNSSTNSAVGAALNVVIPAGAGTVRNHIYKVSALCNNGSTAFLNIMDGATTVEFLFVPADPMRLVVSWPAGLTMTANTATTLNVSSCGAGNVAALSVEADQF